MMTNNVRRQLCIFSEQVRRYKHLRTDCGFSYRYFTWSYTNRILLGIISIVYPIRNPIDFSSFFFFFFIFVSPDSLTEIVEHDSRSPIGRTIFSSAFHVSISIQKPFKTFESCTEQMQFSYVRFSFRLFFVRPRFLAFRCKKKKKQTNSPRRLFKYN